MAIERFIDEIGTNLNKFQVTTNSGDTYEITLLRKANISQVGTLLNASKLNELVDAINVNSAKQITLNGANNNRPSFYASTNAGSSGQVLISTGGTPTWTNQSNLSVGDAIDAEHATNATNDADGNKISTTYAKKSTLSNVATSGSYKDLKDTPSLSTVATSGSYNDLSNKPTIPTKLSQLTNDNRNMYMNSGSWTNSAQLPSKGLYILKVSNSQVFGGSYINLGLVNYDGNSTYWSIYYSGQNYRAYLTSSGGVNFQLWTGNTVANLSGTTYYYYIKLS